ncbi:hypothetical protein U1Q18_038728 [Sarracenia purpurea var. burkii]
MLLEPHVLLLGGASLCILTGVLWAELHGAICVELLVGMSILFGAIGVLMWGQCGQDYWFSRSLA